LASYVKGAKLADVPKEQRTASEAVEHIRKIEACFEEFLDDIEMLLGFIEDGEFTEEDEVQDFVSTSTAAARLKDLYAELADFIRTPKESTEGARTVDPLGPARVRILSEACLQYANALAKENPSFGFLAGFINGLIVESAGNTAHQKRKAVGAGRVTSKVHPWVACQKGEELPKLRDFVKAFSKDFTVQTLQEIKTLDKVDPDAPSPSCHKRAQLHVCFYLFHTQAAIPLMHYNAWIAFLGENEAICADITSDAGATLVRAFVAYTQNQELRTEALAACASLSEDDPKHKGHKAKAGKFKGQVTQAENRAGACLNKIPVLFAAWDQFRLCVEGWKDKLTEARAIHNLGLATTPWINTRAEGGFFYDTASCSEIADAVVNEDLTPDQLALLTENKLIDVDALRDNGSDDSDEGESAGPSASMAMQALEADHDAEGAALKRAKSTVREDSQGLEDTQLVDVNEDGSMMMED